MQHGVSPIVAVVLLIAISVVAGVSLYFWMGGLATVEPTPSTPVALTANPIGDGRILVANLGSTTLNAASLNTTAGVDCVFDSPISLPPGEQAACTLNGAVPAGELTLYTNASGLASAFIAQNYTCQSNCAGSQTCASNTNCASGYCNATTLVCDACTLTSQCDPLRECVSGACVSCSPSCTNGVACSMYNQCASAFCNATGYCAACSVQTNCQAGSNCTSGVCAACSPDCQIGAPCSDNSQCASGFCSSGLCASTTPTHAWNVTWGGASDDFGFDIVTTADNIYVGGHTRASEAAQVFSYYKNGTQQWNKTVACGYGAVPKGIGASGDRVYFAYGVSSNGFGLKKYYLNGTEEWSTSWSGSYTTPMSMAVTDEAEYITGTSCINGCPDDAALAKFWPNSTKAWHDLVNSAGGYYRGTGVAATADAVYESAELQVTGRGYDTTIIKYALNGTKLWTATPWGGTSDDRTTSGIAVGPDAIYQTGFTYSAGNDAQQIILKYDLSGSLVKNITLGGAAVDVMYDIQLFNGKLYATGYTNTGGNYDIQIFGYDTDLNQLWNVTWIGAAGGQDSSNGIYVDSTGIYVTGTSAVSGLGLQGLVIKYTGG